MLLGAGDRWDTRYRIERVLGRGASGVVYRAVDEAQPGHGAPVALKILRPDTVRRDDGASLRLEFALLARFRHPNLVSVRRFATAGDLAYLVVELVDGPTLDRAIAATSPAALLPLAVGVLRGLAYLHANGFVHHDVKPSNILVDAPSGDVSVGTPKLADLGVAALRGVDTGEQVSGTLPFLSPERLRGAAADPRADLWALGITLHACAAGRLPVKAATTEELVRRLEARPIPPLRDACPAAPAALERFTARLLAIDPRERYRDADDALADLERSLGERALGERAAGGDRIRAEPAAVVGRDAVLARAFAALTRRPQPAPRTVMVRGASGLGRTRVLDELAVQAQLGGAAAVRVALRPGLAPWIDALAELRTRPGDATAPGVGEQIADALAASPAVLVVDDLERRDGLARELVARIAVSLAARPVPHVAGVLVGADPGAPVDPSAVVAVSLSPLSPAAIRELVGSALGAEPPAALSALVAGEVGGSPALAVEALRALADAGALRRIGGVWELAGDGAAVIRHGAAADRRVAALSPAARAALAALALFGPGAEAELPIVAAAAALGEDALAPAIAELCATQLVALVRPRDGRGARVRHRSEAVRAALASSVATADAAAIHRRAWDELRARGVTDPELLCAHAVGAGLHAPARELAIAAADAAHARGDHLSALAAADLAATAADAASRRGVVHRRTRALLELGRVADARAALAALPDDPDDALAARLTARAMVAAGDTAAAADAIDRLERLAGADRLALGERSELAALRVEAARLGDQRAAIAAGEVGLADTTVADRDRARIHVVVAQAAMAVVDLDRARAELADALAIAERLDDAALLIEARGWLAAVADMSNRADEARAHVDRGLAHAARAPSGVPFARLLNLRGILAMWAGDLDSAAESMLEAERRARLAGGTKLASSAAGNLVVVYRRRALYGQALAAAMRSLGMKRALADRPGQLTTYINLCDLYAELGEPALAEAAARRGIAGGRALGHRRIWAQGLLSLAGLLLEHGDREGTREALAGCAGAVDEHNQIERWIVEGRLAVADGDATAALAALHRAIERSRSQGNAHDEARALVERAALIGDRGAADLRRAADVAVRGQSLGVAWLAHARLGALYRQAGDERAAERELARAGELFGLVCADLPARHAERYRRSRGPIVAAMEAAMATVVVSAPPRPRVADELDTVILDLPPPARDEP
jgi:hypothetical protein